MVTDPSSRKEIAEAALPTIGEMRILMRNPEIEAWCKINDSRPRAPGRELFNAMKIFAGALETAQVETAKQAGIDLEDFPDNKFPSILHIAWR